MDKSSAKDIMLGLDIGSVSVNVVIVGDDATVLEEQYHRIQGKPIQKVIFALSGILERFPAGRFKGIAVTGTGGKLVAELLGASFVNEIVAQSKAIATLYPEVRTIIEMGGEDSKLLVMGEEHGETVLEDFAMNTLCAAGTGSFLDQQSSRLGLTIEEFGKLALKSENPPRIAGRCSVFAKSDMIHLQQVGTPDYDIVAGLCYAVARNFKSNIAKGRKLEKPIAFQGGVAANNGMRKAFENILELEEGELVIPEHFAAMGAIGAVMTMMSRNEECTFEGLSKIKEYEQKQRELYRTSAAHLEPLSLSQGADADFLKKKYPYPEDGSKVDSYLGIDVGSLSTNLVVIDSQKRVVARRYLPTAGRPLEAIQRGLDEIGREVGDRLNILGVGTTGSGRYLTGDFVGADIVRNEITSQATAAIDIDPKVDTIFEIGGQDSKYISIDNGAVVDFEMNKVCAAGTGSFLEEQAEKLNLNIVEEFGNMALEAPAPVRLGERCTVFMESDLVSHQQRGATQENLVGGLSYSIVANYLNRVVVDRRVGNHIFFQGGVAWNKGVVAAFEKVTGKKITVPPHHDVTGAIGAALLAMHEKTWEKSKFKGFDLSKRKYELSGFECKGCSNRCEIHRVLVENERPLFYGGRCEKYEIKENKRDASMPDLFGEREQLIWGRYARKAGEAEESKEEISTEIASGKKRVGIPRALHFYEFFPYWNAFFTELGFEVVVSDLTNRHLIHEASEQAAVEACFPVKVALGHIINLLDKKIDYLFVPSVITSPKRTRFEDQNSYLCPYVQSFPYMMRSVLDLKSGRDKDFTLLEPHISFQLGNKAVKKELVQLAPVLGVSAGAIRKAVDTAERAQEACRAKMQERGREIIAQLHPEQKAIVIVSRPYNGCDEGINLALPKKLGDLGVIPIPMDFLTLKADDVEDPHMYWNYGQQILSAAKLIRENPHLYGLYITNFGCGPDSFISHFFREEMAGKPYVQIEIDEHSADAGVITRCEAFLDSIKNARIKIADSGHRVRKYKFDGNVAGKSIYFPNMCDHAYLFASVFKSYGVNAEVLPEPDERTLELGKHFTTGKECFPCIVTSGDLLKKVEEPGFDPSKAVFFMPTAKGPCRFGQYYRLQRMVLNELGYGDVQIISPSATNSYSEFGDLPVSFRRDGWKAFVVGDILYKLLHETRPYEVNKGKTNSVYKDCLQMMCDIFESSQKDGNILDGLKEVRNRFKKIEVDKSERKPIIGVVGEIFLRSNKFSNANVIDRIEMFGGEAWLATMSEWVFYVNWVNKRDALLKNKYIDYLKVRLKDKVQLHDEHKLIEIVEDMLLNAHEPPVEDIIERGEAYLHSSFSGEAILSIGKAVDYFKSGLSGIVNTMPLYCMPGTVVSAISKKVREDYDNLPWLNLAYDGQQESNSETRIEAFMHQARQFKKRKKATKED